MLVVKLRKAGCHFAAARARRRHHNKGARRLNVVVAAVALVAYDELHVGGVPRNAVLAVDLQPQCLHALLKNRRGGLVCVLRQRDAAHI